MASRGLFRSASTRSLVSPLDGLLPVRLEARTHRSPFAGDARSREEVAPLVQRLVRAALGVNTTHDLR